MSGAPNFCYADSVNGGNGGKDGKKAGTHAGDGAFSDHFYGFYNLDEYMYPNRFGNLGGKGATTSGNGNLGKGGNGEMFGGISINK